MLETAGHSSVTVIHYFSDCRYHSYYELHNNYSSSVISRTFLLPENGSNGVSRVFLENTGRYFKFTKAPPYGWCQARKFLKFFPPDALKMFILALPVLRFLWKTFSKLIKFILGNTLLRECLATVCEYCKTILAEKML